MLRRLLFIATLFLCSNIYAQEELIPMYLPSATPKKVFDDGDTSNFKKMGAPLPKFRLVTLPQGRTHKNNGTNVKQVVMPAKSVTNKEVKSKANLLVMVFNPNCGHCEDQTDTLEKYIYLFKKSKLVMACAPSMGTYLEQFEKDHHTNQYPTIQIGLDSSALIRKIFLYTNLPQINIYDKNRKLIKTFTGGASMDSLRRYIE